MVKVVVYLCLRNIRNNPRTLDTDRVYWSYAPYQLWSWTEDRGIGFYWTEEGRLRGGAANRGPPRHREPLSLLIKPIRTNKWNIIRRPSPPFLRFLKISIIGRAPAGAWRFMAGGVGFGNPSWLSRMEVDRSALDEVETLEVLQYIWFSEAGSPKSCITQLYCSHCL